MIGVVTKIPPLSAQTEPADQAPVSLDILFTQVVQQSFPLPDELEQSSFRVIVMPVFRHVLGKLINPLGQHRYLDFG